MLLRVKGSTLEVWRHAGSTWSRLGVVQDTTYAAAGFAGVGIRGTTGRLDDFGARSLARTRHGAPTALAATRRRRQREPRLERADLRRRLPITNYKVYRGLSSGSLSFLDDAGATTSYVDGSASNGTTYYYKVSAVNGNGEGALSNEASATPADLVTPVEPLPVVDSFDRPNENPLSDAGRWTNGVSGVGGDGSPHDLEHARLLEDDDLHGLAQPDPVRP